MSSDRKSLSTSVLMVIVTLLSSCSPASSFAFLPRVSRTNDAIIINCMSKLISLFVITGPILMLSCLINSVAGVGYAPFYHGKTLQGHIVNPEFVPLPSFNLQPMAFRQQQQDPSGWSYSFGYPNPIALEDASSSRQGGGATTTTTSTTTPAPAIKCGQGPTALPKQSLMSERVSGSGSTSAKANAWPFLVS
jgi:hypothetical protein